MTQIAVVGGLNYEYTRTIGNYSNTYQSLLEKNPNDNLNATWELTRTYYKGFDGTYNIVNADIPSRNFAFPLGPIPIFKHYMNSCNGFQKLLVIQQKGNCGEFSQSIAYMMNDSTHLPTRVINYEGIDHMTPEIEINNQWWVFDIDYLTGNEPINSFNFFNSIPDDVRDNIANIYSSSEKDKSLLKEHGFNETSITITTILDMPANVWSGKGVEGATIQVFTQKNSHDPLVSKGITNANGKFSTILNKDKDYWIFTTYESNNQKLVGFSDLTNISSSNLSMNVSITNYDSPISIIGSTHEDIGSTTTSSIDLLTILYQIVIAGCAIGGLLLSIKNYLDRKSESVPDLKLQLEEWIDNTNLVKQKCIRCLISNRGKLPVKYENLGIFYNHNNSKIELYHFTWVSPSIEKYSAKTYGQDILFPNDSRMAIVRPQKLVRKLEELNITERKILIFIELKSAVGDLFVSDKISVNLSGIEPYDRDSNRIE